MRKLIVTLMLVLSIVVTPLVFGDQERRYQPKWEYKVVVHITHGSTSGIAQKEQRLMDQYADQGWRLVAVQLDENRFHYYFERRAK
jgi:hypothetical protein